MNVFFDSCHEAIDHAVSSKLFGLYYSETFTPNLLIHMHDCCEIFLALSDGNHFLIDDKVYTVNKNDLFIINQFEAHKVNAINKDKFLRYSFHIHSEFIFTNSTPEDNLYDIFSKKNKIDKIHLDDDSVKTLCNLFNSLKETSDFGDLLYKKIHAIEILIVVGKILNAHKTTDKNDINNSTLKLAIDFINENFTSQLTLKDIATHCFVSVNQLCALFRNTLSTTVVKYITSLRITLAKKYLSEGKSVTDTAYLCGFNDYANFIRTFKSHTGFSPKKFNEKMKK